MENKFNVLDPVLVYATIDSINVNDGKLVYSLKITTNVEYEYAYIDFVPEDQIQTVF